MRHRHRLVLLGVLTFFIAVPAVTFWLVVVPGAFDSESSYLLWAVLSCLAAGWLSILFSLWVRRSRTITEADEPRVVRLCTLVFIEAYVVLSAVGGVRGSDGTALLSHVVNIAALFLLLQVAIVISLVSHRWIGLPLPTLRELLEDMKWVGSRAPHSGPET